MCKVWEYTDKGFGSSVIEHPLSKSFYAKDSIKDIENVLSDMGYAAGSDCFCLGNGPWFTGYLYEHIDGTAEYGAYAILCRTPLNSHLVFVRNFPCLMSVLSSMSTIFNLSTADTDYFCTHEKSECDDCESRDECEGCEE
jgi:hypothetical protein